MGIPVPNGKPSQYSWQVGSGLGRGVPTGKGGTGPGAGGTRTLHPLLMSLAAQSMGLLLGEEGWVAGGLGYHPPGPCASGTPWRPWEAASPHPHREKKEGATCPFSQGCSPASRAWPTACLFPQQLPDWRGRAGHQPSSGPPLQLGSAAGFLVIG